MSRMAVPTLESLATKTIITQGLFKNVKPECRSILTKALQPTLLQAVVDDDRVQVKNILEHHPDLLLLDPPIKPIESQYTWQKFYAESPLKMAIIRNQVEMIKVMLPYLQQLDRDQVTQQWREAEAIISQQKTTYDFDALIRAINTGGQPMKEALQAFRDAVLPKDPIALNNYYNIEALLLAACQAYVYHLSDFYYTNKGDIFCVKITGFLQSLVTPEVAQVFCEGIYYVVGYKAEISKRARSLKLLGDYNFYRASNSAVGLGYEYLCDVHLGDKVTDLVARERSWAWLETLFRKKASDLTSFKAQLQCPIEPKPRCVIL